MPDYRNDQGAGLGKQAVAYAARFIGLPYVWGGESPAEGGFDCSGLVQFVYKHLGVKLPRTTFEQVKSGIPVSRSNLQEGDLLFFNSGPGTSASSPGHVSIYAGNGQEIVASTTGKPIMRRAVDWGSFVGARRVSGDAQGAGGDAGAGPAGPAGAGAPNVNAVVPVGWHIPGTPWDLPTPGDAIAGVEGAAAGITRAMTRVGIMAPVVAGGVVLIVLGAWRATSGGASRENPAPAGMDGT